MKDRTYRYAGPPGEFVPGLPADISEDEAKALGVLELLKDAVKNGLYKETKEGE